MIRTLAIIALALAGMNNAQSIGITLDRIQFQVGANEIEIYPPFSRFHMDNEYYSWLDPNYAINWKYGNTEELASLEGHWYFRGSELTTSANISFTLSEPVSFLMTGWIRQPEWHTSSFTSVSARLGSHVANASEYDLTENDTKFPSLTGIFRPGQYVFEFDGFSYATESDSHVLIELTPVAIPETGHTALLLGLTLGVIGILRLPKALA